MEKNKISKDLGWQFPLDPTRARAGLSGDIELFQNHPLFSLAKESAQNSLDARLDPKKPVILEFKSFDIQKNKFPNYLEFDKILKEIRDTWKIISTKDQRVKLFTEYAKKTLNHYKILCLRISDFNTTGLSGAMKETEAGGWRKLVKDDTVSNNDSLAGGSFGLGKNSAFASSDLHVIFYSTMDIDGYEAHQGVANLASYYVTNGQYSHRKGYYGHINDYLNIKGQLNLDDTFKRRYPGTDIYILGFNNLENMWKEKIFCSIMESFLLAIYNEDLIFKFEGEELNKESLKDFIAKYRSEEYKDIVDKNIFDYYDILEGNINSKEYKFSIIEENDVVLKLALQAELNNKISMNRITGMKIFNKSKRGSEDCSGVLTLTGNKLNAYLRNLEGPNHDGWYPERFKQDPESATRILKKLDKKINESIKDMNQDDDQESLDAEGMGEYLPDEFDEDVAKRKKIEDIPWEISRGMPGVKKKSKEKIKITGKGGGKGGGKNNGSGGTDSNNGPGEDPNKPIKKIIETNFIRAYSNKDRIYSLIFSMPEESSSLNADILISGEDGYKKILLIDSAKLITKKSNKNLECTNNKIFVGKVSKNEKVHIEIKLKDSEKWALEVLLYEN